MLEFYASTEGNVTLYNVEGKVGAIGRVADAFWRRASQSRWRASIPTPRRRGAGRTDFARAAPSARPARRWDASAPSPRSASRATREREDTEKKILRDVFAPGDAWMRTGDLMRRDAEGFYYFVDRVGDTFRWKGENVATREVAAALAACAGRR